MKDKVYFIGFMGAGKTTIGKLYAKAQGWRFIDTDVVIEQKSGCSVAEIFESQGEKMFRKLETAALRECGGDGHVIVSCGGGIVLNDEHVKFMKEDGVVIYLKAGSDTLAERLAGTGDRPLLQRGEGTLKERISALLSQRSDLYENAADIIIDTDQRTPEDIVEEIKKQFLQKA